MLDSAAFDPDLQGRDHVTQRALRIRFGFQLPSIPAILPSLPEAHVKHEFEHVKHGFEHVKLCVELPCFRAITLRFV
jgi:hypothetical protein